MKVVVWGIGTRGKRMIEKLGIDSVVAFIDSNPEYIGTIYKGKEIIDFTTYKKRYANYVILISPIRYKTIEEELVKNSIYQYLILSDCPPEISGPGTNALLKEYISKYDVSKKYGIYGINLFSLLLYEQLHEMGCKELLLFATDESDRRLVEFIAERNPQYNVAYINNYNYEMDKLLITVRGKKTDLLKKEKYFAEIEEAFEFTDRIVAYHNIELKKFKDLHKGKRCFIVATGPSLRMDDLDILKENNEFCIGMNRVHLAFKNTEWRPNYYVVTDYLCIMEDEKLIEDLPVEAKFVSDQYFPYGNNSTQRNIYRFHEHGDITNSRYPKFTEDISKVIYGCGTVSYDCLQIAAYMGFEEIYLLGVDFNFTTNYKDKNNHFTKEYYNSNSKAGLFLDEESLVAYKSANKYANEHGIKIYNATRGGKLEVFERVNFDSLFIQNQNV